jgi:hypothetical protein
MLAQLFGLSRQGFYKRMNKLHLEDKQDVVVEKLVVRERKLQQRIGGKKLYRMLKPELDD